MSELNFFMMTAQLLGGLGFFFYGMNRLTDALQKLAAGRLRQILQTFTRTTMRASVFGILLTVALQSSAATTVLVVEFVGANFLTVTQGLNIVLSASLGAYVLLQVMAFPMLPAAFVAIFAGVLPYFTGKDRRALRVGQALIGFGCIFVGISYMSSSFLPLREIPGVSSALSHLGAIPILGIIAGTLLAALLQSSSVFLAIVISMAGQGLISTPAILALVMGAHIGGTMTTLISSLGANHIDAKRVAVCNTFYRVTAALLLYPFITPFSRFAELMSVGAQGEVASAYLWTTIFMVLIFLPFNKLLAGLLTKLMPDVAAARGERHLLYIRPGAQALPVVALNQAWQEARWLGQYVLENMFELALRALRSDQERWLTEISTAEELAENHYVGITSFLASLPYSRLTEQEIMDRAGTQKIAHEWREVARNLGLAGSNIARHRQEISALGEAEWEYLEEVYKEVAWLYLCTLGTAEKRAEQSGTAAGEQRLRLLREGEYRFIFREDSFTSEKNVLLDLCNYMYIIATHLRQIRERVIQG